MIILYTLYNNLIMKMQYNSITLIGTIVSRNITKGKFKDKISNKNKIFYWFYIKHNEILFKISSFDKDLSELILNYYRPRITIKIEGTFSIFTTTENKPIYSIDVKNVHFPGSEIRYSLKEKFDRKERKVKNKLSVPKTQNNPTLKHMRDKEEFLTKNEIKDLSSPKPFTGQIIFTSHPDEEMPF